MSKNILYLSYDGLTDPLGQSQVLPYIIGLCNAGYHFHVISFEKVNYYASNRETIEALISDLAITWYPQQYHKRPPILSTIFDLRTMYQLSKLIVKQHGVTLVHCRSYPPGLIGLKLKKQFGLKFLFDIRGFWANERVDGGIWRLSHPVNRTIYNYFKKKEIILMEGADHIISLTHAGKEEVVSGRLFEGVHQPIPADKITVIPCAVDTDLFDPSTIKEEDKIALKVQLGLEHLEEIFVYLGSIGTWYLLDEMIACYKQMRKKQPYSKFLFVTKDDPEVIWSACDRLGLGREHIVITSASRVRVPLHLAISTTGLFFIKPAYSKKASSAVKMGEMLAMGLDLITNSGVGDSEYFPHTNLPSIGESDLTVIKIASSKATKLLVDYELDTAIKQYLNCYNKLL
ncbi:MAG: glycosyltransferase involved in cell wall biosynthesis [Cyclobacteriaceae bacterium]|jgi:glycosyltransferase involved in cell wall biosynthesis